MKWAGGLARVYRRFLEMKWLDECSSAPPTAPCWDGVKMATGLIRAQHTDAHESSALVCPSPFQFSSGGGTNVGGFTNSGTAEVKIQLERLEFLLVYTAVLPLLKELQNCKNST